MFKKPKRHFRQRKVTDGSDHEDDADTNTENVVTTKPKSVPKGKPNKRPDKPISFDLAEIDGEGLIYIVTKALTVILQSFRCSVAGSYDSCEKDLQTLGQHMSLLMLLYHVLLP